VNPPDLCKRREDLPDELGRIARKAMRCHRRIN
jgi:hypothetical protein